MNLISSIKILIKILSFLGIIPYKLSDSKKYLITTKWQTITFLIFIIIKILITGIIIILYFDIHFLRRSSDVVDISLIIAFFVQILMQASITINLFFIQKKLLKLINLIFEINYNLNRICENLKYKNLKLYLTLILISLLLHNILAFFTLINAVINYQLSIYKIETIFPFLILFDQFLTQLELIFFNIIFKIILLQLNFFALNLEKVFNESYENSLKILENFRKIIKKLNKLYFLTFTMITLNLFANGTMFIFRFIFEKQQNSYQLYIEFLWNLPINWLIIGTIFICNNINLKIQNLLLFNYIESSINFGNHNFILKNIHCDEIIIVGKSLLFNVFCGICSLLSIVVQFLQMEGNI